MAKQKTSYELDDAVSVEDNITAFKAKLTALNPALGAKLGEMLTELLQNPPCDKGTMLTELRAALDVPKVEVAVDVSVIPEAAMAAAE